MACACIGQAAAQSPLRVFLRGGPKTHGSGEHDHPAFVADWTPLLKARGASVEGSLEFPTADQLARTDVLVLYAAEGGSIHGADREHLESYLARGGGIVAIHDSVCGDDPQWFKTVIGGAWEHGHAKWATGTTDLYVRDFEHPITKGVANWRFEDELYTDLHMMPDAHVLMAGFQDVFNITPQMWTYEKEKYRAFVAIQGHYRKSFEHDAWRTLLLRGIAWSGKRDVDLLTSAEDRASLAYPTGGPLRPEAAQKALVLHEGFEASLVAAEPLIVNPISLDWDPRGRLWVAETPGYPMKEEFSHVPAHDTISILEDKDGDGRMDGKRVFADGLDLVTSFVFHEDGVIALAAPNIFFLRDSDGDGLCDKREVLFTGFGYQDTHAVMSNARWGLDGWIYATQGYSGNGSTDVRNSGPSGERHFGKIGNGIFRFKPDGSAIEIVSSYGSNTWGLDFTPDGELFFSMANGAHLRHVVVPEKALARARLPGTETWSDVPDHDRVFPLQVHNEEAYRQIDFIGGFTAASGCCVYDGGAWPKEFEGRIYVTEPTVNLVHEDVITPNGVTFKATKSEEKEFIASADLWFRPVHMRIGPDGAMYVLDFYNQAAVHNDTRGPEHGPTNAAVRPDRDQAHGRIWRVQHRDVKPGVAGDMIKMSSAKLVAELQSPNGWKRGTVVRLLSQRNDASIQGLLETALAAHQLPTPSRAAALWTLGRMGKLRSDLLAPALGKQADAFAKQAANAAVEFGIATALASLLFEFHSENDRTNLVVLQALADPATHFAQDGLFLAASRFENSGKEARLWERSLALSLCARDPLSTVFAVTHAGGMIGGNFDQLMSELATRIARDGDAQIAGRFVTSLADDGRTVEVRAGLARLARDLNRDRVPPWSEELRAALAKFMTSTDLELAAAALDLTVRWDAKRALAPETDALANRLESEALNRDTPVERRVACLRSLFGIADRRKQAFGMAEQLLTADAAPELQLTLIDQLGRSNDETAAGVLARRFKLLSVSAREQAFTQIVRRPKWVEPLLVEIEAGRVVPNDLGPLRLAQLKNHGDEAVATRARAVLEKIQGPQNKSTAELLAKILPVVESPGDAAKGKQLFTQNCATCHTYKGEGAHVGPDLTGMGAHGVRALLPVILDPNASVEAAYLEYAAITTDDRMITGIIVRDTPQSVVLRATTGDTEIPRDELVSLKSTGRSPMPVGLESIGAEGLRDVLAYMTSEYPGFRVLDLRELFNMCSLKGMYDPEKGPDRMDLERYGVMELDGIPFEIRDPEKAEGGRNVVCLRGGMRKDWFSVKGLPKLVEVPVGFALQKMHVLGGIAAWGFPCRDDKQPCVKWTWVYDDGSREEVVLHDGVEFADWIGRRDVPGSKYVEDLVKPDSYGQIRTFDVAPSKKQVVAKIVLESYDNHLSPTFIGLTAELDGAVRKIVKTEVKPLDVLVVGGGSSHDFERWFKTEDLATLEAAKVGSVRYTEGTGDVRDQLAQLQVLCLTNNQPLAGEGLRAALDKFYADGGGLVLVHPATWFNWNDWPEYNARWVGGGARSHEKYGEFEVRVVDAAHPLAKGVSATFRVADELYETTLDPTRAKTHVIAVGHSLSSGKEYPVLWTVERARGRTACLTLGHDAAAHELDAYRAMYVNAIRWAKER
ncbi:MAG: PVC-type heme-binding CxxCH protein [Planctomycetota bacterium]